MSAMTSDRLLSLFVETRRTGSERPGPIDFETADEILNGHGVAIPGGGGGSLPGTPDAGFWVCEHALVLVCDRGYVSLHARFCARVRVVVSVSDRMIKRRTETKGDIYRERERHSERHRDIQTEDTDAHRQIFCIDE